MPIFYITNSNGGSSEIVNLKDVTHIERWSSRNSFALYLARGRVVEDWPNRIFRLEEYRDLLEKVCVEREIAMLKAIYPQPRTLPPPAAIAEL